MKTLRIAPATWLLCGLLAASPFAAAISPDATPQLKRTVTLENGTHALDTTSRIVGGKRAADGQIPWQVALLITDPTDPNAQYLCGGSIIGNGWVLTAAHCVHGHTEHAAKITVVSATTHLGALNAKRTQATQVVVPDAYSSQTYDFDVALVKAETEGPPITLTTAEPAAGAKVTVSGYGRTTEAGITSDALLFVELEIKSRKSCNSVAAYNGAVSKNMICAARPQSDSCQGDSGGPLYSGSGQDAVLVGVVSWGEGCARPGKYGVYANLSSAAVRKWIKDNAK